MSARNGSADAKQGYSFDKGKGKAAEPTNRDEEMGEDSSSEEEIDETTEVVDEPDEDNMEEIDTNNIITSGRRTRGLQINFAKAAQELLEEDDEEEDDDDDDFVEPIVDEDKEDKMEE